MAEGDSKTGTAAGENRQTAEEPSSPEVDIAEDLVPGDKQVAADVPVTPGGDNSIQAFGTEGEADGTEQAATALKTFLDARAAGDFRLACEQIAENTTKLMQRFAERVPRLKGAGCPQVVRGFTLGIPERQLVAESKIEVLSFRTEGKRGFMIYGAKGKVWAIPMSERDGEWRLTSLGPVPLGP